MTVKYTYSVSNDTLNGKVSDSLQLEIQDSSILIALNKIEIIADILDISIKTVETQMGRALKKLRENLKHLIIILIYNLNKF